MRNDSGSSEFVGLFFFGIIIIFLWWIMSTSGSTNTGRVEYSEYSEGYEEDYGDSYDSYNEPETFMGYECIEDCSGHEAGYEWAYENEICDPGFYESHSDSFNEGVQAYNYEEC